MVQEGVVAENEVILANMRRLGHLKDINQDDLIAILDYYCNPDLPLLSHDKAQILVGLETIAAVRAKDIDLHHSIHRSLFRQMFRMGLPSTDAETSREQNLDADRGAVLRSAISEEQATEVVTGWLVAKLAHILGFHLSDMDLNVSIEPLLQPYLTLIGSGTKRKKIVQDEKNIDRGRDEVFEATYIDGCPKDE